MTDNNPEFTSDPTAPKSTDDGSDDVTGHFLRADHAPGIREAVPGVRTYPKAGDDDGSDDVSGHVFIESKDDSGTRRDA